MENKFNYEWTLKDAKFTKDKGKVFSCFACGGGSTMGYKLAGFDVLGCNEIDPKMIEAYRTNHNPDFSYLEPIQTFKLRKDLPKELYNLDILDGSPPCSSFSMSGNREKDWGKEKKFKEGQAKQVLDTLFFDFIDLAKELQPKIVVAENVAGMMMGSAKEYVKKVYEEFKKAGYQLRVEPYLLDASKMGVPQKRKRVFFIAIRNDISKPFMEQVDMFQSAPKLNLTFNEKPILFKEFDSGKPGHPLSPSVKKYAAVIRCGESICQYLERKGEKGKLFSYRKVDPDSPLRTILSAYDSGEFRHDMPFYLHPDDLIRGGSYPLDYNFLKLKHKYLIGMSVPPIMTAQIACRIYEQWLSKI
tara:strand:+ start:399 stop:1472 length:1074 start_codon:yes stop_codon:yes gene_type:complete